VQDDHDVVRLLPLPAPVTRLGRAFDAHLRLDDSSVSRRHAVIVDGPAGAVLVAETAVGETLVNREPVTSRLLHSGDEIRLGRSRVWFLASEAL
jgi:pSer/pThr/pTyr-binding forkhead associated (FHA) protein